jgi:hypothetical protein
MGIAAHWRYRGCPLGGVLSTRQNDQGGRVSGCSGRSKGMATAKGNIDSRLRSYLTIQRQEKVVVRDDRTCIRQMATATLKSAL